MKKLLVILLLLVSFITLTACGSKDGDIKILNQAFDKVTIANADNVTSNLTLVDKVNVDSNEVKVTWKSSNKYLVSDTGVVTRPELQNENVIMSATLTFNEATNNKNIVITVKKIESPTEPETPTDTLTIQEILSKEVGQKATLENVGVVVLYKNGFYVTDNINYLFIYTADAPSVTVGDKVNITNGEFDRYFQSPQLKGGTIEKTGEFGTFTKTPNDKTVAEIAALDYTSTSVYTLYTIKGMVSVEGSNYIVKDSTNKITILNGSSFSDLLSGFNGKEVKMNVIYNSFHSTQKVHRVLFLGASTDIVEVV